MGDSTHTIGPYRDKLVHQISLGLGGLCVLWIPPLFFYGGIPMAVGPVLCGSMSFSSNFLLKWNSSVAAHVLCASLVVPTWLATWETGGPFSALMSSLVVVPIMASSVSLPSEIHPKLWTMITVISIYCLLALDVAGMSGPLIQVPNFMHCTLLASITCVLYVCTVWHTTELDYAISLARKAQKEALSEAEHKGNFLSKMSHEMRTPLMGIVGWSDLMLEDQDISEDQRSGLQGILSSTRQLQHVIDQVLQYSSLSKNTVEPKMEIFDVGQATLEVVSAHCPLVEGRTIRLSAVIPRSKTVISADPYMFQQCVRNLVGNALKFTDNGMIQVRVWVERDTLFATVKDSGIGMSQEQAKRVLEPFRQADNSIQRRFGGTGLGLTITKEMIEGQGGSLDIHTALGVGTTMKFHLPVRVCADSDVVTFESLELPPVFQIEKDTSEQDHVYVVQPLGRMYSDVNRRYSANLYGHSSFGSNNTGTGTGTGTNTGTGSGRAPYSQHHSVDFITATPTGTGSESAEPQTNSEAAQSSMAVEGKRRTTTRLVAADEQQQPTRRLTRRSSSKARGLPAATLDTPSLNANTSRALASTDGLPSTNGGTPRLASSALVDNQIRRRQKRGGAPPQSSGEKPATLQEAHSSKRRGSTVHQANDVDVDNGNGNNNNNNHKGKQKARKDASAEKHHHIQNNGLDLLPGGKRKGPAEQQPRWSYSIVCEDDPVCRKVVEAYLARMGKRSILGQSGLDAVDYFRESLSEDAGFSLDLIVLDLNMPLCDGKKAALEISRIANENGIVRPPIVILSGDFDVAKKLSPEERKAIDSTCVKPVGYDQFSRVIQDLRKMSSKRRKPR